MMWQRLCAVVVMVAVLVCGLPRGTAYAVLPPGAGRELTAYLEYCNQYMVYAEGMGYNTATTVGQLASATGLSEAQAAMSARGIGGALSRSGVTLPAGMSWSTLGGMTLVGLAAAGVDYAAHQAWPMPVCVDVNGEPIPWYHLDWTQRAYWYYPEGWLQEAGWGKNGIPPGLFPGFSIPSPVPEYVYTRRYTPPANEVFATYGALPQQLQPIAIYPYTFYAQSAEANEVLEHMWRSIVYDWPVQVVAVSGASSWFTPGYLYNRVTGASVGLPGWSTKSQFTLHTVDGVRVLTSVWNGSSSSELASAVTGYWSAYNSEMGELLAAGLVTDVSGTQVAPVEIPIPSPVTTPNVFRSNTTDEHQQLGTVTLGELDGLFEEPAGVPEAVAAAFAEAGNESDSMVAVGLPSSVGNWISSTWADIVAPVTGLFDSVDWLWPFHFMNDNG